MPLYRTLAVTAVLTGSSLALNNSTWRAEAGSKLSPVLLPASDSAEVVAVVANFHAALADGDSAKALSLLAPDAVILESGEVQNLAEYRAHHLPADIAFARAVPSSRSVIGVAVSGNSSWVTASSVTAGTYNGRAVNSAGVELTVLSRTGTGAPWRIRAVHWSSRRRPS
jgi:ketosteroid isomerase-like protein